MALTMRERRWRSALLEAVSESLLGMRLSTAWGTLELLAARRR